MSKRMKIETVKVKTTNIFEAMDCFEIDFFDGPDNIEKVSSTYAYIKELNLYVRMGYLEDGTVLAVVSESTDPSDYLFYEDDNVDITLYNLFRGEYSLDELREMDAMVENTATIDESLFAEIA